MNRFAMFLHRILGKKDALVMTLRLQRKFVISALVLIGAAVFPIYMNLVEQFLLSEPLLLWLLAAGVVFIVLIRALWVYKRQESKYYSLSDNKRKDRALAAMDLPIQMKDSGYCKKAFFNGVSDEYYVYSPVVNRKLQEGWDPSILSLKRTYQIGREMNDLVPAILHEAVKRNKRVMFNGALLRQAMELFPHRNHIYIQKTHYFDTQCTNEAVFKRYRSAEDMQYCFDGLDLLTKKGNEVCTLLDLDESPCSNNIGVSTMAITSDHRIAIGCQSAMSKANPGRFAPSGSGSSNYSDLAKCDTLSQLVILGMERELQEEMGLSGNRAAHITCETQMLGYARLLERGGKPDYFGITHLHATSEELQRLSPGMMELNLQDSYLFLPFEHIEDIPKILRTFCTEHLSQRKISIQVELITCFLEELQQEGMLKEFFAKLGITEE